MNQYVKTFFAFFLSFFACFSPLSTPANASEDGVTLIVMAEDLPAATKLGIQKRVVKILAEEPAGHKLVVVRGRDHTPVLNITLPAGKPRERFRDRGLAKSIGKLKAFLLAEPSNEAPGQIGIPNLPSTYWQVAAGHGPCNVILCGNPIFQEDDRHPFWNFSNSRFPSDPALTVPHSGCPFVNRGMKKIPADVKIAILSPASWGDSEQHRGYVSRWLVLAFQESLGGTLMRISNSANAVFGFQGDGEFETVVPRKNRTMIGVWQLAANGNITPFPAEGKQNKEEISQPTGGTQQVEPEADRVSEGAIQPNEDSTIEQNVDSEIPELSTQDNRTSQTDSRSSASTEDLTQPAPARQTDTSLHQVESYAVRQESTKPKQNPLRITSKAPRQRPTNGTTADPRVSMPTRYDGKENNGQSNGLVRDPQRPSSAPAHQTSHARIERKPTVEPEPAVSARLRKLASSKSWPDELARSMVEGSRQVQPGYMVVVTWQSICPHADVNLYLAGASVRRDVANESNGEPSDRIEWAHSSSLSVDGWLNNFFTHKNVDAKLSVVDLSSGKALEHDEELGLRYDRGHHASWRESSPAWKKFQLSSIGR